MLLLRKRATASFRNKALGQGLCSVYTEQKKIFLKISSGESCIVITKGKNYGEIITHRATFDTPPVFVG